MAKEEIVWHKVLDDKAVLPDGRVMTVTAGHKGICLVHYEDNLCALDNHCPHQGRAVQFYKYSISKGCNRDLFPFFHLLEKD